MSYLTNQILRGAETIRRNSREEWKGRAEKAEAEVERLKLERDHALDMEQAACAREAIQKAEVERLKAILHTYRIPS